LIQNPNSVVKPNIDTRNKNGNCLYYDIGCKTKIGRGKTTVVTGSASGIGFETSLLLVKMDFAHRLQ
jgi:hypothetical protein